MLLHSTILGIVLFHIIFVCMYRICTFISKRQEDLSHIDPGTTDWQQCVRVLCAVLVTPGGIKAVTWHPPPPPLPVSHCPTTKHSVHHHLLPCNHHQHHQHQHCRCNGCCRQHPSHCCKYQFTGPCPLHLRNLSITTISLSTLAEHEIRV